MPSIVIIGAGASTCTRRVAAVCKELGVDYTIKAVEFSKLKSPEHFDIHPFGQIPVLEDPEDGFILYESRAISRYLVQKFGKDSSLIPQVSDIKATARFESACSVEVSNFDKIVGEIVSEKVFKHWYGQETDQARVDYLFKQLEPKLDGYERILSKSKYLAGETLTLADLFHLPYGYMLESKVESKVLQERPNVARWWNEISSRDSWKAVKDSA